MRRRRHRLPESRTILSTLGAWEQAIIAVSLAILLLRRVDAHRPHERLVVILGALALLPLPTMLAPQKASAFIVGKEGLVEALTVAVLLALAALAWRRSAWLFGLATLLLLAEELDYGQRLLRVALPSIQEAAPRARHGNFNFHNEPGLGAAFRIVPLLGAWVLSVRERWPSGLVRLADRVGLPALHRGVGWGLLLTLVSAGLVAWLVGEGAADEAGELAAVAVVGAGLLLRREAR